VEIASQQPGDVYVAGDYIGRDVNYYGNVNLARQHVVEWPLFIGLPAMPAHFVGRDDLLAELLERLVSEPQLVLALEGLAGVGKTTLALALALHKQVVSHFSDGVLWASLGRSPEPKSILATWTEALCPSPHPRPTAHAQVEAVYNAIGPRRVLVVLDDVWEKDQVELLWRSRPNVSCILTTRIHDLAGAFASEDGIVSVPVLGPEPGFRLLCTLVPKACQADPGAAQHLVQLVDGLPLALRLLGGYLAAPKHRPSEQRKEAIARLGNSSVRLALASKRLGEPNDKQTTLMQMINLSLEDVSSAQRGAFYALGAFAPKPASFSDEAAQVVANVDATDIEELADRNLLEVRGDGSLAMHPVLADAARAHTEREIIRRHRNYYLEQLNGERPHGRQAETIFAQLLWSAQADPTPLLASLQRFVQNLEQPEPERRSVALLMTTLPAFARLETLPEEMLVLLELVARHLDTPAQRWHMIQAMTSPLAAALPARQQAQLRVHRAALLGKLEKLPEARADYQATRRILQEMRASNTWQTDDYRLEAQLHLGDGNLSGLQVELSDDPTEQQNLQAEAVQHYRRAAQSLAHYGEGRDPLLEAGVHAELSVALAQLAGWTEAEKHYQLALASLEPMHETYPDLYAQLMETASYIHWQKANYLRALPAGGLPGGLPRSANDRREEIRQNLVRARRYALWEIEILDTLASQSEGLMRAHDNAGDYANELAGLAGRDEQNQLRDEACLRWRTAWLMAGDLGFSTFGDELKSKIDEFCPQAPG
jgi:hypothetical protein